MDWIGYVVTAAGTAGTILIGILGWRVSHRTQKATERNMAHEQDDATFARVKSIVEILQSERDRIDAKHERAVERIERLEDERKAEQIERAADRRELDEMHRSVETLRGKVQRLEGRLIKAVNYIRDLLGLLAAQGIAHPPIPDEIAHLFDTKPGGTT